MAASPITIQVLSGRELQVLAEPGELVSVVRQRVEEQLGIGEFQELKLWVGLEELRYDVSVGESGMLNSTVQAVLAMDVCKAKKCIDKLMPKPAFKAPPPLITPNAEPVLRPFSLSNCRSGSSHKPCSDEDENERKAILAFDVLAENDADTCELFEELRYNLRFKPLLLAHVFTRSGGSSKGAGQMLNSWFQRFEFNLENSHSAVWIKLIGTLAPYEEDFAHGILCQLASLHMAAEVRVAAVRAFGFAPSWAWRHIKSLRQIAYAVEADPDETVREAAAASAQALREAQARGDLAPNPPVVMPAPPLQAPPPARRNFGEEAVTEEEHEELQKSTAEDLQREQEHLQGEILRSRADAWNADGIIVARLTFHNPALMEFLLEADDLSSCRSRVEDAGCEVQPPWAHGALLLVPVTEQQIMGADINLQAHNILMLSSDEELVKDTLAKIARRKRPELKPEHYPQGKPPQATTESESKASSVEAQLEASHASTESKSRASSIEGNQEGPQSTTECKPKASDVQAQLAGRHVSPESTSKLSSVEVQQEGSQGTAGPTSKVPHVEAHHEGFRLPASMREVELVVERTLLNFAIPKDISEASTIVYSAPAEGVQLQAT